MTTAKSVHDFFKEDSFFDNFGPPSPPNDSSIGTNDSSAYSPISVALTPDTPMQSEKRHHLPDGMESSSKAVKSDGSKSAAAASRSSRKPGRKPDTNEPENKRKAQNRAAQRAFRERKERHLKELEDRVMQLENENDATNSQNEFLKIQVERLQTELKKYRTTSRGAGGGGGGGGGVSAGRITPLTSPPASTSPTAHANAMLLNENLSKPFTFEFPFFSGGGGGGVRQKRGVSQRSSADSGISPMSAGSVSSESPNSSISSESSPSKVDGQPDEFCAQLNMACGTKESPLPKASSVGSIKATSPVVITAASVPSWSQSPGLIDSNSRTPSTFSPSEFEFDFVGEYRDPLFDGEQFTLPELATSEYSMFDPLENPIANTTFEMLNKQPTVGGGAIGDNLVKKEDEDETVPAGDSKLMSCTAVWDRICSHPKFGDIDIDGLCHELRAKAKCSDTGALLTEKDVDKVLKAFS